MSVYRNKPNVTRWNPRNRYARGIVLAALFNDRSGAVLVRDSGPNKLHGTQTGGTWEVGPWGSERAHTATTNVLSFGDASKILPLSGCSVVIAQKKRDATLRGSAAFGIISATGNTNCNSYLPFSNGNAYWDFGGVGEGVTRLSIGGLTFGEDVFIFTTGPRGMEIFQNGIKRASNAANPTRSSTTSAFGMGSGVASFASDLVNFKALIVYNRQLPLNEIQVLSSDPFAAYRVRRLMPLPMPAAVAGGLLLLRRRRAVAA